MSKKYNVGYTTGVFDMFHIGHLNILKKAKEMCEYLIVGVSTDELVEEYKHKTPIISYDERAEIVRAIRYVDEVVPQKDRDKIAAFKKLKFDVIFVGDDWKESEIFDNVDKYMKANGGKGVEYVEYTKDISSTLLSEILNKMYEDGK